MKIVLDTNVIISGLISNLRPPGQLLYAWLNDGFHLVTSTAQLAEIRRVVVYDHLRPLIAVDEADEFFGNVDDLATVIKVLPEVDLSPDPDDNAIIATALAGQADLIVTGDKRHLLSLEQIEVSEVGFKGATIPIITARQALERLGRTS